MKTKTKENEITIKQLIEEFKNKEFEKIYLFNDLLDFDMTLTPKHIKVDRNRLDIYLEGINFISININKIKSIRKDNILTSQYKIRTTYE